MKKKITTLAIAALGLCANAGEMYGNTTFRGDIILGSFTNTVKVLSATNTGTSGKWAATGAWWYAISASNSAGSIDTGAASNVTIAATSKTAVVTWNMPGGMSGARVWRGSTSGTLTQFVDVGAASSFTDRGTNTWTAGTHGNTFTNVVVIRFQDGSSLETATNNPVAVPLGADIDLNGHSLIRAGDVRSTNVYAAPVQDGSITYEATLSKIGTYSNFVGVYGNSIGAGIIFGAANGFDPYPNATLGCISAGRRIGPYFQMRPLALPEFDGWSYPVEFGFIDANYSDWQVFKMTGSSMAGGVPRLIWSANVTNEFHGPLVVMDAGGGQIARLSANELKFGTNSLVIDASGNMTATNAWLKIGQIIFNDGTTLTNAIAGGGSATNATLVTVGTNVFNGALPFVPSETAQWSITSSGLAVVVIGGGSVTQTGRVGSVNGVAYDATGNVALTAANIPGVATGAPLYSVTFTASVKTVNGVAPDATGNVVVVSGNPYSWTGTVDAASFGVTNISVIAHTNGSPAAIGFDPGGTNVFIRTTRGTFRLGF